MTKPRLLCILPDVNISYTKALTNIATRYFSFITFDRSPQSKKDVVEVCKKNHCHYALTANFGLITKLFPYVEGSANSNIGTVFTIEGEFPVRLILIPQILSIYRENSGVFMMNHWLKKLSRGTGTAKDGFAWEYVTPQNLDRIKLEMNLSFLCAVDIETTKEDLRITSVAYTYGIVNSEGEIRTKNYAVKVDRDEFPFCWDVIGVLNKTKCPKVMQRGMYDSGYFLRFDVPLNNYIYDTYALFYCMFPELPKDLAFISSFVLDNFTFWKEEFGRNLYEYNAKDTHNTFWVWIALIKYIAENNLEYAYANYLRQFPLTFPYLSCNLTGMLVDEEVKSKLYKQEIEKQRAAEAELRYYLDEPNFNPGSPKQVKEMFLAVGYRGGKGTDVKEIKKFIRANPLYAILGELILSYRKAQKAAGTYFDVELLNSRLMYEQDPFGTDSGRSATKGSFFWCGTQVQNIPMYARVMCISGEGKTFAAIDKAQSESWCTGFLSQDINLIKAVSESPDFHCQNASMFFGIPFEELFDVETGKKLNVPIRDIAKRVNHGANYNMGEYVLLETMGIESVLEAKRLLELPMNYSPIDVCRYLLAKFDETYTRIRGQWYDELVREVVLTGKSTIPAVNWTRRTFLRPLKSKPDLNTLASFKPQSLSAHLVHEAFLKIWKELQLKKFSGKFKLVAQIHDELLIEGDDDIIEEAAQQVADYMVIPVEVEGRTMAIPSTTAIGKIWSEC